MSEHDDFPPSSRQLEEHLSINHPKKYTLTDDTRRAQNIACPQCLSKGKHWCEHSLLLKDDTRRAQIARRLREIAKDALCVVGGSGGRRECRYCFRPSFRGQPEHYVIGDGADEDCEAVVAREAARLLLTKRRTQ